MPKKSFIKVLLDRRIPHILGSYLVAGTSLILFIEYLVDKYQFPSHYPTLSLFALMGILPSVIILSYFHGAPGKDEWTKVEKVGIPVNVFFIAVILFFGDSLNVWNIEKGVIEEQPEEYLIHFTSLYDEKKVYEEWTLYQKFSKGRELDTLGIHFLDTIRRNIKAELLSEYYNYQKEFHVPTSHEDIEYLNNNAL